MLIFISITNGVVEMGVLRRRVTLAIFPIVVTRIIVRSLLSTIVREKRVIWHQHQEKDGRGRRITCGEKNRYWNVSRMILAQVSDVLPGRCTGTSLPYIGSSRRTTCIRFILHQCMSCYLGTIKLGYDSVDSSSITIKPTLNSSITFSGRMNQYSPEVFSTTTISIIGQLKIPECAGHGDSNIAGTAWISGEVLAVMESICGIASYVSRHFFPDIFSLTFFTWHFFLTTFFSPPLVPRHFSLLFWG